MEPHPDLQFYRPPRLVTHIDDRAIAAVGSLYAELAVDGEVLDLMVALGLTLPDRAAPAGRARDERRRTAGQSDAGRARRA